MIENLSLDVGDSGGGREDATPLRQGDAIDRTEKRLLTAKASTNTVTTINIDSVRITDQLKYMKFRYLDSGIWQDSWGGPNPPTGVEISLGVEPYSVTNVLEEYRTTFFRRTISIPRNGYSVPRTPQVPSTKTSRQSNLEHILRNTTEAKPSPDRCTGDRWVKHALPESDVSHGQRRLPAPCPRNRLGQSH